jgi:predicted SAM-dependent methyltransferase
MDFEQWRADYDDMSYKDQVKYHNEIEANYPEQAHYTYQNITHLFNLLKDDSMILEFGTWKGDMANRCFVDYPQKIKSWVGIEICEAAIEKTRCLNPKFSYIFPDRFDWFVGKRPKADVIVATHFIEHLKNDHFDALGKYCQGVEYILFEAPLSADGESWEGYHGTHKLNYGWNQVVEVMGKNGYELNATLHDARLFKSK